MTPDQLKKIMPRCDAVIFTPLINACFAEFGISTKADQASFLGNIGAETGGLTVFSENLNYSAEGLLKTFKTRYTPELAAQHAHKPEMIANHVYAGRYGNGDEASGDGWRYRGGGGIQLTFKANYEAGARRRGVSLVAFAAWVRTPEGAVWSAGDFWKSHGISTRAADFDGQCDMVNIGKKTDAVGDAVGFAKRLEIRNLALGVL